LFGLELLQLLELLPCLHPHLGLVLLGLARLLRLDDQVVHGALHHLRARRHQLGEFQLLRAVLEKKGKGSNVGSVNGAIRL
jgi:hypothetical protein